MDKHLKKHTYVSLESLPKTRHNERSEVIQPFRAPRKTGWQYTLHFGAAYMKLMRYTLNDYTTVNGWIEASLRSSG